MEASRDASSEECGILLVLRGALCGRHLHNQHKKTAKVFHIQLSISMRFTYVHW